MVFFLLLWQLYSIPRTIIIIGGIFVVRCKSNNEEHKTPNYAVAVKATHTHKSRRRLYPPSSLDNNNNNNNNRALLLLYRKKKRKGMCNGILKRFFGEKKLSMKSRLGFRVSASLKGTFFNERCCEFYEDLAYVGVAYVGKIDVLKRIRYTWKTRKRQRQRRIRRKRRPSLFLFGRQNFAHYVLTFYRVYYKKEIYTRGDGALMKRSLALARKTRSSRRCSFRSKQLCPRFASFFATF